MGGVIIKKGDCRTAPPHLVTPGQRPACRTKLTPPTASPSPGQLPSTRIALETMGFHLHADRDSSREGRRTMEHCLPGNTVQLCGHGVDLDQVERGLAGDRILLRL